MEQSLTTQALPFNAIPTPPEHWLKGSLGKFEFGKFHQFLAKNAREYGPIFKIRLFNRNMVVIADPKTVQYILKNRPDRFRRTSNVKQVFKELGIDGVFTAEEFDWKKQRQLMNHAFKLGQISRFFPKLIQLSHRLCQQVEKQPKMIDVRTLFQRYSIDTITNLAFGCDTNTLEYPNSELQQYLNLILPMVNHRVKAPCAY